MSEFAGDPTHLSVGVSTVMVLDDDIRPTDLADVGYAFSLWQQHQDTLVGFFPRSHTYDESTGRHQYTAPDLVRGSTDSAMRRQSFDAKLAGRSSEVALAICCVWRAFCPDLFRVNHQIWVVAK